MNVAMMDLICAECERRRSSAECLRRLEDAGLYAVVRERDLGDEGQIEQLERSFGRNWKW